MDLEKDVRDLIMAGDESSKVDFKSEANFTSREERMGLAKLISAIANTDDPLYDNYGYIILGAKRGEITGGMEKLSEDTFSASLNQSINSLLDPQVRFNIKTFEDDDKGAFAAFIIPPSTPHERPHFIAREGKDGKREIYKGQCFVRYGDRTELAQKSDYERMFSARYQEEIDRLRSAMAEREQQRPNADVAVKRGKNFVQRFKAEVISINDRPSIEDRVEQEKNRYLNPPHPNRSWERGLDDETPATTSELVQQFINASSLGNSSFNSSRQYDRRDVEVYLPSYQSYLQSLDKYNDAKAQLYELRLVLRNDGTVPAENLTLILRFPSVVQNIVKDEDAPKKPKPPEPPEPCSQFDLMSSSRLREKYDIANSLARVTQALPIVRPRLNLHPPNVSEPLIKDREVKFEVKRLPHGLPLELDFLHLSFVSPESSEEGEYSISYTIHADNQQQAKNGQLTMCFKAEQKEWYEFQREQWESSLADEADGDGDEDNE